MANVANSMMLLVHLSGCQASPPPPHQGQGPGRSKGNYVSLVHCTPPSGRPVPSCPSASCPNNVIGPPDGTTVDLSMCPTLDLIFTGGTIIGQIPEGATKGDITFTMGNVAGLSRVEASINGSDYIIIGFIAESSNSLLPGAKEHCAATVSGNQASLFLTRCNPIANASFLRIIRDASVPGTMTIDAVEALSFKPSLN